MTLSPRQRSAIRFARIVVYAIAAYGAIAVCFQATPLIYRELDLSSAIVVGCGVANLAIDLLLRALRDYRERLIERVADRVALRGDR